MTEVPGADSRRSGLEEADRGHHPPGEDEARQDGEEEAQHEDDCAPEDRGPERRVGVGERPLDEDEPPEGGDAGVGREDLAALETLGDRAGVIGASRASWLGWPLGSRGPHLGKGGEVPVLAGQPDVRVGEQATLRVHDVGVAARADLDLGDRLLDGLEADLGGGDLDGVLSHWDGEGQVGLDAVPEVDRAPVRLP